VIFKLIDPRHRIWNYEEAHKINVFSNHTSRFLELKNKVTTMKLLNEESDSLLLCGSGKFSI
jgi:hypothetical protein